MIVRIIPAFKLKAGLNYFDYDTPPELDNQIQIGQLARIPFRNSEIFGVIFEINPPDKHRGEKKIISGIFSSEPIFSEKILKIIIFLANLYGISAGVILKMFLPPLQKRKILNASFKKWLPQILNTYPNIFFHHYKNLQEQKEKIKILSTDSVLILVPQKNDIDNILNCFSEKQRENIAVWHSDMSEKEKFKTWFEIRNNEKNIVIGTRGAICAPIQNFQKIIIVEEHNEQHKNWDQYPRFHTRDIAFIYKNVLGIEIHLLDYSPSSFVYHSLYKNLFAKESSPKELISAPFDNLPIIADMSDEIKAKNFSIFSNIAENKLKETDGNIFVYINRRGISRAFVCTDCGRAEKCAKCGSTLTIHKSEILNCHYCKNSKPMPTKCSNCNNTSFKTIGIGTQFVEKKIKEILPNRKVARLDKDIEENFIPENADVIVGTEMAFSHLLWPKIKLVIFADIDLDLTLPNFNAQEKIWHLMEQVQFSLGNNGSFVIQTRSPQHFVFKSLREPDRFYRLDLHSKKTLGYPPYSFICKYTHGNINKQMGKQEAERFFIGLRSLLTQKRKNYKLMGPLEATPVFYRNKFWFTILLTAPLIEDTKMRYNIFNDLAEINKNLPVSEWRIDPSPNDLLSN